MLRVTLNNGVEMPILGFGVFQIPPEQTERVVAEALRVGHRKFDTASAYRNEEGLGRAIKRSGIPREELFITTKLWVQDAPADGNTKKSFNSSLTTLQLQFGSKEQRQQAEKYHAAQGAQRILERLAAAVAAGR